jgi:hypothetical protein
MQPPASKVIFAKLAANKGAPASLFISLTTVRSGFCIGKSPALLESFCRSSDVMGGPCFPFHYGPEIFSLRNLHSRRIPDQTHEAD